MMEITSDAILKGPIWANVIDRLKGVLFDNQWEIYAVCIALGIMQDTQIEFESDGLEPKYIPRNVMQHYSNKELLDVMFTTAILTTTTIKESEDYRTKLAFDKDENHIDFNKINFLTKFANYGANVLNEQLSDTDNPAETMKSIRDALNKALNGEIEIEENLDDSVF